MEARREKMIQAKASFQQQGSLDFITREKPMPSVGKEKPKYRNIYLIIRWMVAVFLFILYIYGRELDTGKIGEFCQKSAQEIQKKEKYI